MSNCIQELLMTELRNFREETALTSTEEIALKFAAGKLGLSKSATLRLGLLRLVDHLNRADALVNTGLSTEI